MADLIAGPDYAITPTEAFVLGGAFLCHDLAMSLGAYPDGLATLRGDSRWSDTVAGRLRERLGRSPSKSELKEPPPDILEAATQELLRLRHAEQAEQLPTTRWTAHRSADSYYLIDDPDLRSAFGSMIGRVAHSHWWPVTELARKCRHVRGAPGGFPNSWTIDELKVAALLRTADAGHLDERSAPGFLMAIRKPPPDSAAHWSFQGKLGQPQLIDDRLLYTSTESFEVHEAPAWWLCWDSLRTVDRELREVDALLADSQRPRFQARSVARVEIPERLA